MANITASYQRNPQTYMKKEFGHYYMSASQTTNINAGDPLKFDTCAIGNIAFNPTTYTWTLKANRTYKMKAEVQIATDQASAYICCQWRTTAGTDIGNSSQAFPTTMASNTGSVQVATSIYTPTVDTDVRCCIDLISHVTTIYGGAFPVAGAAYAQIQEIDNYIPAVPNNNQYEYVSPELDLAITQGTATLSSVSLAKGIFKKTNNGIWWLDFTVAVVANSAARTAFYVNVTGISINGTQAISASCGSAGNLTQMLAYSTTRLEVDMASASNTTFFFSGLIELTAKPTGYAIPSDI